MGYVKISFVPFLMLLKPPFWSWLSGKQKHYYLLWRNLPRIKLVSLTPFKVEKKLYSRKSLNSKVKFWKETPLLLVFPQPNTRPVLVAVMCIIDYSKYTGLLFKILIQASVSQKLLTRLFSVAETPNRAWLHASCIPPGLVSVHGRCSKLVHPTVLMGSVEYSSLLGHTVMLLNRLLRSCAGASLVQIIASQSWQ